MRPGTTAGPARQPLPGSARQPLPAASTAVAGATGATFVAADQVKPTFRMKCPSRRSSTPPPAQCTIYASRMMARITTTSQKKSTTIPGMPYPATVLALTTGSSYPAPPVLFRNGRYLRASSARHARARQTRRGERTASWTITPRGTVATDVRDAAPCRDFTYSAIIFLPDLPEMSYGKYVKSIGSALCTRLCTPDATNASSGGDWLNDEALT